MKPLHLLAVSAAMAALLAFPAAEANAQRRDVGVGYPVTRPHHDGRFGGGRFHRGGRHGFFGFPAFWIVEREVPVVIEREVVREVPAAAPPAPPPPPRKPYVVGNSYASLPGGCMKMIEDGASYYFCGGGEWYRQVGGGKYKAVAKP